MNAIQTKRGNRRQSGGGPQQRSHQNTSFTIVEDDDADNDNKDENKTCDCQQNASAYICTACNGLFYGRLRRRCAKHPNVSKPSPINPLSTKQPTSSTNNYSNNLKMFETVQVIFLMDLDRCVHCFAGKYMINSIQLDEKTVMEINAAMRNKSCAGQ